MNQPQSSAPPSFSTSSAYGTDYADLYRYDLLLESLLQTSSTETDLNQIESTSVSDLNSTQSLIIPNSSQPLFSPAASPRPTSALSATKKKKVKDRHSQDNLYLRAFQEKYEECKQMAAVVELHKSCAKNLEDAKAKALSSDFLYGQLKSQVDKSQDLVKTLKESYAKLMNRSKEANKQLGDFLNSDIPQGAKIKHLKKYQQKVSDFFNKAKELSNPSNHPLLSDIKFKQSSSNAAKMKNEDKKSILQDIKEDVESSSNTIKEESKHKISFQQVPTASLLKSNVNKFPESSVLSPPYSDKDSNSDVFTDVNSLKCRPKLLEDFIQEVYKKLTQKDLRDNEILALLKDLKQHFIDSKGIGVDELLQEQRLPPMLSPIPQCSNYLDFDTTSEKEPHIPSNTLALKIDLSFNGTQLEMHPIVHTVKLPHHPLSKSNTQGYIGSGLSPTLDRVPSSTYSALVDRKVMEEEQLTGIVSVSSNDAETKSTTLNVSSTFATPVDRKVMDTKQFKGVFSSSSDDGEEPGAPINVSSPSTSSVDRKFIETEQFKEVVTLSSQDYEDASFTLNLSSSTTSMDGSMSSQNSEQFKTIVSLSPPNTALFDRKKEISECKGLDTELRKSITKVQNVPQQRKTRTKSETNLNKETGKKELKVTKLKKTVTKSELDLNQESGNKDLQVTKRKKTSKSELDLSKESGNKELKVTKQKKLSKSELDLSKEKGNKNLKVTKRKKISKSELDLNQENGNKDLQVTKRKKTSKSELDLNQEIGNNELKVTKQKKTAKSVTKKREVKLNNNITEVTETLSAIPHMEEVSPSSVQTDRKKRGRPKGRKNKKKTSKSSIFDEPSVEELSVHEPSIDKPSNDESSVDEPSIDKPSIDEPSVVKPSIDKPSIDEPSIDKPSNDETSIDEPSVNKPSIDVLPIIDLTMDEEEAPTIDVEDESVASTDSISTQEILRPIISDSQTLHDLFKKCGKNKMRIVLMLSNREAVMNKTEGLKTIEVEGPKPTSTPIAPVDSRPTMTANEQKSKDIQSVSSEGKTPSRALLEKKPQVSQCIFLGPKIESNSTAPTFNMEGQEEVINSHTLNSNEDEAQHTSLLGRKKRIAHTRGLGPKIESNSTVPAFIMESQKEVYNSPTLSSNEAETQSTSLLGRKERIAHIRGLGPKTTKDNGPNDFSSRDTALEVNATIKTRPKFEGIRRHEAAALSKVSPTKKSRITKPLTTGGKLPTDVLNTSTAPQVVDPISCDAGAADSRSLGPKTTKDKGPNDFSTYTALEVNGTIKTRPKFEGIRRHEAAALSKVSPTKKSRITIPKPTKINKSKVLQSLHEAITTITPLCKKEQVARSNDLGTKAMGLKSTNGRSTIESTPIVIGTKAEAPNTTLSKKKVGHRFSLEPLTTGGKLPTDVLNTSTAPQVVDPISCDAGAADSRSLGPKTTKDKGPNDFSTYTALEVNGTIKTRPKFEGIRRHEAAALSKVSPTKKSRITIPKPTKINKSKVLQSLHEAITTITPLGKNEQVARSNGLGPKAMGVKSTNGRSTIESTPIVIETKAEAPNTTLSKKTQVGHRFSLEHLTTGGKLPTDVPNTSTAPGVDPILQSLSSCDAGAAVRRSLGSSIRTSLPQKMSKGPRTKGVLKPQATEVKLPASVPSTSAAPQVDNNKLLINPILQSLSSHEAGAQSKARSSQNGTEVASCNSLENISVEKVVGNKEDIESILHDLFGEFSESEDSDSSLATSHNEGLTIRNPITRKITKGAQTSGGFKNRGGKTSVVQKTFIGQELPTLLSNEQVSQTMSDNGEADKPKTTEHKIPTNVLCTSETPKVYSNKLAINQNLPSLISYEFKSQSTGSEYETQVASCELLDSLIRTPAPCKITKGAQTRGGFKNRGGLTRVSQKTLIDQELQIVLINDQVCQTVPDGGSLIRSSPSKITRAAQTRGFKNRGGRSLVMQKSFIEQELPALLINEQVSLTVPDRGEADNKKHNISSNIEAASPFIINSCQIRTSTPYKIAKGPRTRGGIKNRGGQVRVLQKCLVDNELPTLLIDEQACEKEPENENIMAEKLQGTNAEKGMENSLHDKLGSFNENENSSAPKLLDSEDGQKQTNNMGRKTQEKSTDDLTTDDLTTPKIRRSQRLSVKGSVSYNLSNRSSKPKLDLEKVKTTKRKVLSTDIKPLVNTEQTEDCSMETPLRSNSSPKRSYTSSKKKPTPMPFICANGKVIETSQPKTYQVKKTKLDLAESPKSVVSEQSFIPLFYRELGNNETKIKCEENSFKEEKVNSFKEEKVNSFKKEKVNSFTEEKIENPIHIFKSVDLTRVEMYESRVNILTQATELSSRKNKEKKSLPRLRPRIDFETSNCQKILNDSCKSDLQTLLTNFRSYSLQVQAKCLVNEFVQTETDVAIEVKQFNPKAHDHNSILTHAQWSKICFITMYLLDNNGAHPLLTSLAEEILHCVRSRPTKDEKLTTSKCIQLAEFLAAMCQRFSLLHTAQSFIYDVIYWLKLSSFPIVYSVIKVYPNAIPAPNPKGNPVIEAIIHCIMQTPTHSALLCHEFIMTLRRALWYNYGYSKDSETSEKILQRFLNRLTDKDADKAIVLICKRESYEWVYKNVVMHLLNLLQHDHVKNEVYANASIRLIGLVTKAFPFIYSEACINSLIATLKGFLFSKSGSILFKEEIALTLCNLAKFNCDECAEILFSWKPELVSAEMLNNISDALLSVQPVQYWNNYISKRRKKKDTFDLDSVLDENNSVMDTSRTPITYENLSEADVIMEEF